MTQLLGVTSHLPSLFWAFREVVNFKCALIYPGLISGSEIVFSGINAKMPCCATSCAVLPASLFCA